jgi:ankyrin repeat protein
MLAYQLYFTPCPIQLKQTPIHFGATLGFVDVVELLVLNNANTEALDISENTPLHKACINGHVDVVHFLLTHRPNLQTLNEVQH